MKLTPINPPEAPTFSQALRVWVKIGLLSFGGPTGQIALMHRELVEKHRWISDARFLHALNYCMLLPGPEAQQLAIYIGWLLHRVKGGVIAGLLFVLPGAVLMWIVSMVYVLFGKIPLVEAVFYGLKPAVMAIVLAAVLRIGRKALRNAAMWTLAAASFVAIFYFKIPFPLIILSAGLFGLVGGKFYPGIFDNTSGHAAKSNGAGERYVIGEEISRNIHQPSIGRSLFTAAFWMVLWLLPVVGCFVLLGKTHVLSQMGLFFSKAAIVTFGGAYAVLPYVAQQAVENHGWLAAPQMLDGLGLAETTPGPLILVLQFVGFLGGWNAPGGSLLQATLAAVLTSWVTFLPGCLFIFTGAPWIERSRGNLHLNTALSAVTAAVVGVVLNLAVWFGWHVVVPSPGNIDWFPVVTGILFFLALQYGKRDVLTVVAGGAIAGLIAGVCGWV